MTPSDRQDAPTPRTDALVAQAVEAGTRWPLSSVRFRDVAYELERELVHVAAQTATLEREVAELRKDRERLDWLEKMTCGRRMIWSINAGIQPASQGCDESISFPSFRAALDNAMSAALTRATPSKEGAK